MGELGALFNPGMRHEIEERESKQNRREEEGNARDGDVRIDLASGVAVINVPGTAAGGAPEAGDGERSARTVGEKPSAAALARRSAHLRAEERKSTSARNGRSADQSAAGRVEKTKSEKTKSDKSKSGSEKSDTPRPVPAPSSKASRTSR